MMIWRNSVFMRADGIFGLWGRPTFWEKTVEKYGKMSIMRIKTAENMVVVPYLWGIETPNINPIIIPTIIGNVVPYL